MNDDKANDSDRGSDGPDPQEWYTGGASSGQAVIDPRERPEARLAAMFDGRESARARGQRNGGGFESERGTQHRVPGARTHVELVR